MSRKAMQDFTFSEGTRVGKGELLSVASRPVHFDPDVYPRTSEFDGWRFVKHSQDESGEVSGLSLESQFVNIGLDFLPFGVGRHAWYVPRSHRRLSLR